LGPSAHSYNIKTRQWNVSNNHLYIQSIQEGNIPFEIETLDTATSFNEYMMISLRLMEGVELAEIEKRFGPAYVAHTQMVQANLFAEGKLAPTTAGFAIAKNARFLADGIASEFFIV
jgi:oxygen-independent coproporphyrinogen-3 oxidase